MSQAIQEQKDGKLKTEGKKNFKKGDTINVKPGHKPESEEERKAVANFVKGLRLKSIKTKPVT